MNNFPTLYKRNSNGSIQQWTVYYENDRYWTVYGQVNGKLVTTEPTIVTPKNVGKKHETTVEEQAEKEAKACFTLKQKSENYVQDIEKIDELTFQPPMLAKDYHDFVNKIKFPLLTQPKLDGIRCNIINNKGISRRGNEFQTVGRIVENLKDFMKEYPTITLDGELYCDKYNNDFNAITSLVKKQKPTEEELKEIHSIIEYHIYDMWDEENPDMIFTERSKFIKEKLSNIPFIKIVPTYEVNNQEEMDKYFEKFVEDGYEGQMLRLDTPYEHKRSKNLLKRKEFIDEEFVVVDISEGVGNKAGMAAFAYLQDKRSPQIFKSNIKGNWAFCKDLLINKNQYIGKEATIKYFQLTPKTINPDGSIKGGVPRFGYLMSFRDYE